MSQAPPRKPAPARRKPMSGRKSFSALAGQDTRPPPARRASVTVAGLSGAPKVQRTSKTSQKLVLLPSAVQTKPLPGDADDDGELELGYETDAGLKVRDYKSEGERLSKDERRRRGFRRITAYCVAEGVKMKLLAGFLRREHNVVPRIFDEAMYVMYHLPLLPGYGPHSNVRSSAPAKTPGGRTMLSRMSEAEENGYEGTYFTSYVPEAATDGYIPSSSPADTRHAPRAPPAESEADGEGEGDGEGEAGPQPQPQPEGPAKVGGSPRTPKPEWSKPAPIEEVDEDVAEVVFFDYGVVVFFGLDQGQERSILEDIENAGILTRKIDEDNWEVEECHFEHDPHIAHPRIYNDFFTLKSPSHLLKLSISHAFAQSTLLARYETTAQRVLSAPDTVAIPKQLARSGALQLKRRDALRLTGRLFKLRRDVNLVSNVLDVPELFWSEASLKDLYDAVREYMEINRRVQALNEKLGVANDLLDAIHDHLNYSAMERITWIIIWLIVVACMVELGEILARLVVHATQGAKTERAVAAILSAPATFPVSREDALRTLERMMVPRKALGMT